jgi:hypothetical protein
LQASDVLAAVTCTSRVDTCGQGIHQLLFSDLNAGLQQVDDGFFARVHQLVKTGDRHGGSVLLDVELSGSDRAVGGDVDDIVARVRTSILGVGVVVHDLLQDHVTAAKRLDVALLLQTSQERVLLQNVVGQLAGARLNRGQGCYRTGSLSHASPYSYGAQTMSSPFRG